MAKSSKKSPSKAAKKPTAKGKSASKKAKKAVAKAKSAPKKAAKKAVKKLVAKKVAPKKVAAKKAVAKAPAIQEVKRVFSTPASRKQEAMAIPKVAPQLTIFPIITQRPIAHKPSKPSSTPEDKTRYSDDELNSLVSQILREGA